ncbi:Hunchback -like protein [Halotydeus destructor]|nr:Hunchback -like protein [Halotydeus destructor]
MDPLAQLQSVIEKNAMFNMKFNEFSSLNCSTNPLLFSEVLSSAGLKQFTNQVPNLSHQLTHGTLTGPTSTTMTPLSVSLPKNKDPLSQSPGLDLTELTGELYRCHLCTYAGPSRTDFGQHISSHFAFKCSQCDYTSRTEGRLKRHVRDFHSEKPPASWAGNRNDSGNSGVNLVDTRTSTGEDDSDPGHHSDDGLSQDGGPGSNLSSSMTPGGGGGGSGKQRKYSCKQCNFIATNKVEFWDHNKQHIKSEKLLTCPKCPFVTEYKHHLEYHLRNHFGSKPFKCAKCNYSCVNKSMLNSHMKSHSNIYQYRCKDCSYATKYCHSLKLHLRKYGHQPAMVLNLDGTPNPYPIIDVYGTRRGPRPKNKNKKDQGDDRGSGSSPDNRANGSLLRQSGGAIKSKQEADRTLSSPSMHRVSSSSTSTSSATSLVTSSSSANGNLMLAGPRVSPITSSPSSLANLGSIPMPTLSSMGFPFLLHPNMFPNSLMMNQTMAASMANLAGQSQGPTEAAGHLGGPKAGASPSLTLADSAT